MLEEYAVVFHTHGSSSGTGGYVESLSPLSIGPDINDAVYWEISNDHFHLEEIANAVLKFAKEAGVFAVYLEMYTLEHAAKFSSSNLRCVFKIDKGLIHVDIKDLSGTSLSTGEVHKLAGELKKYLSASYLSFVAKGGGMTSSSTATTRTTPVTGAASPVSTGADIDEVIAAIAKETNAEVVKPTETLKDYVANAQLMAELEEIKDFFERDAVYKSAGVTIPKGILFKGPPGTGKTYAARCIAGSTEAYFMVTTASALQGQYIGSGAENIRKIFKGAKMLRDASKQGVIIFIDELDSLGNRDSNKGAGGEENRTLNQLLAEMSGFSNEDGIMVLSATNYAHRLDDALMRSGRFSRQIDINYPDDKERENILEYYLKKITFPIGSDIHVIELVKLTEGLTPADIREIINEAVILAIRNGKSEVYLADINEAINKVITKAIRKPDADNSVQELVATHEMGHVLAEFLYGKTVPIKVTNYSYGSAGGFAQSTFNLRGMPTQDDLISEIRILLGGRAAEEVILGRVTTGASSDLERAIKILRSYYDTYHFEKYDVKSLDQTVLDKLHEIYQGVIKDFKDDQDLLNSLTKELYKNRIMYTKDITLVLSRHGRISLFD